MKVIFTAEECTRRLFVEGSVVVSGNDELNAHSSSSFAFLIPDASVVVPPRSSNEETGANVFAADEAGIGEAVRELEDTNEANGSTGAADAGGAGFPCGWEIC